MQCDFISLTDMLMKNMSTTTTTYYLNLLNTLFGSYLKDSSIYQFDKYTATKLHKGVIRVSPEMSEYYLNTDRKIVCRDIKELLGDIFDKAQTYNQVYNLVRFDNTLSVSMRKEILSRVPVQYADDNSLIDVIYEAVYIAVTRQYEKTDITFSAIQIDNNFAPIKDVLFANSEYIPPCKHFCGRDKESDELHKVVSENSTIIITGVAGIGKSELVRAYAKAHKKEYLYFGYYFYNRSLKEIIADIMHDPVTADSDLNTRYQHNLDLLSELGEKVLLIIDNFDTTPDNDKCFDDLSDLKCKVIFTSHMRFEDYPIYELQAFRHVDAVKELTRYFYSYKEDEWKYLLQIFGNYDFHPFCVELCAKAIAKGVFTPEHLYKNLRSFKIKDFAEKLSAKKDKHPKKKTCYDHIRELFHLLGLPDLHKQVLRIMVFAPSFGFRKKFFAEIMNLKNMVIVEDLIDVGLLYENYWGRINIHSVVAEIVRSELGTNQDTCSDFIETVRAFCLNEANTIKVGGRTILQVVASVFRFMDFNDTDFQLRFISDCFRFTEHFGEITLNDEMLAFEKQNHREDTELKTLYLFDSASYEMMQKHLDIAINYQMQAVECSKSCNNSLLKANTMNTYGYYLNLADRKEEALKAMQAGLALFGQLDGDGTFYYDKYRAVINYADLLFSLGRTDDAISQVSAVKKSLQKLDLQNTEVYADCIYSLGLYHLCLNNSAAGEELLSAFSKFIALYGKDSDFVQTRVSELKGYIDMNNTGIIQSEPLRRLLGE